MSVKPNGTSNRRHTHSFHSDDQSLGVSREFNTEENGQGTSQDYLKDVGIQFSHIIDSMIEINGHRSPYNTHTTDVKQNEEGVRLFSSSVNSISLDENLVKTKVASKRPIESSSSDSSEDERLASAAVSHDFLFKDIPVLGQSKHDLEDVRRLGRNEQLSNKKKLKKKKKKE